ncbi:MAG: AAA family ATPase [Bryobacteraceae bacterium]|nr:AAA family ATPase [Bryobacteraceae bacterium]
MACAGTITPIPPGATQLEFCYDYFDPPSRLQAQHQPAFTLSVLGLSLEEQAAAFALIPTDPSRPSHWFKARWGRMGTGPTNFMPIPAQTEEDDRVGVTLYGHKTSNFNWRSCQWEIVEVVPPRSYEMPLLDGELIEIPNNQAAPHAFRDGVALANLDLLAPGKHEELSIEKEAEAHGKSYLIHFGGRIWRRWLDGEPHAEPLELLAFDPASPLLDGALEGVWGDIGGQEEAKRELIRAIQWPVLYPELFVLFKRRRSRGVLLYGPPGCGKTLLGKAVVKLLAALYRRKAEDGGFQYVKGHQLLDQYVGNSEKMVKSLFDAARRWKETRGYPAVLFFDEADALFKRRPSRESGFTLVPALLAEMDGMDDSGAFVILATNRADALDEAITRPGRIDRRIRITRPEQPASARIFAIHLEGVFLAEGLTASALGELAARELYRPSQVVSELMLEETDRPIELRLSDLASGALIQNIVDRATANKMADCIERGVREGLAESDLVQAISEVLTEQRESKHVEEWQEMAERHGRRVVEVRRQGA